MIFHTFVGAEVKWLETICVLGSWPSSCAMIFYLHVQQGGSYMYLWLSQSPQRKLWAVDQEKGCQPLAVLSCSFPLLRQSLPVSVAYHASWKGYYSCFLAVPALLGTSSWTNIRCFCQHWETWTSSASELLRFHCWPGTCQYKLGRCCCSGCSPSASWLSAGSVAVPNSLNTLIGFTGSQWANCRFLPCRKLATKVAGDGHLEMTAFVNKPMFYNLLQWTYQLEIDNRQSTMWNWPHPPTPEGFNYCNLIFAPAHLLAKFAKINCSQKFVVIQ